jgi:hypothetical protein
MKIDITDKRAHYRDGVYGYVLLAAQTPEQLSEMAVRTVLTGDVESLLHLGWWAQTNLADDAWEVFTVAYHAAFTVLNERGQAGRRLPSWVVDTPAYGRAATADDTPSGW